MIFTAVDTARARSLVLGSISAHDGAIFAFCNMHTFNLTRRSPALVGALARATVFNDGIGIDVASRLLHGRTFPANLNGTDLTPDVLGAFDRPTTLFLIGGAPGVAERAAAALATRFAHIRIAGTADGFFAPDESAALAARVRAAGTDLVLLGMGNPRQELWAAEHGAATGAVTMCVGAFLDFAADVVSRAPRPVRMLRLEWFYRLCLEPRRLAGRYIGGAVPFLRAVLHERRASRRSPGERR